MIKFWIIKELSELVIPGIIGITIMILIIIVAILNRK